jgi:ATP synthase protein I
MSGNGGPPEQSSFEDRLIKARQRQGLDAPRAVKIATGAASMGSGLRAGVELVSCEAVAGAIGWGLDRLLHTLPLFLIIFIMLGGVAGILNVWRLMPPPGGAGRDDKRVP